MNEDTLFAGKVIKRDLKTIPTKKGETTLIELSLKLDTFPAPPETPEKVVAPVIPGYELVPSAHSDRHPKLLIWSPSASEKQILEDADIAFYGYWNTREKDGKKYANEIAATSEVVKKSLSN